MGKFKVGWPGQRIKFEGLCEEFEKSHFAGISEGTIKGYRAYLMHIYVYGGMGWKVVAGHTSGLPPYARQPL